MVCQDCYIVPARRGEYTCAACGAKEPTEAQLQALMSDGESASEQADRLQRTKGERVRR